MKSRSYTGALRLALMLFPALLCAAVAPAAVAAEPAPAWQIIAAAQPTYFVPGSSADGSTYPQYSFLIYNVGGATAEGVVITDVLPTGVSPGPEAAMYRTPANFRGGESGDCSAAGQTVTCTVIERVVPGDFVEVVVPVSVSPSAPPAVTNELSVESANAAVASSSQVTPVSTALPPFDFGAGEGLYGAVFDEAGGPPLAGTHPYMTSISIAVPTTQIGVSNANPAEALRSTNLELPQGLVVNPKATRERCPFQTLNSGGRTPGQFCSTETQVGDVVIYLAGFGELRAPLYNMVPPPGTAAELGFELETTVITIAGGVSSGFHLTARSREILSRFTLPKITVNLWGVPSDPRHDNQREGQGCRIGEPGFDGCSIEPSPTPFVTMPTACGESPTLTATITGWLGGEATRTQRLASRGNQPFDVSGCNALAFAPTIKAQPTTDLADSPTGLEVNIHQPQDQSLDGRATAALKDTTVILPEGMTLNASAANGLASCTEAEMGYAPEEGKIRFAATPQSCPAAAKVGAIAAKTPLLDHPLAGAVYVAKPYDNPFGSLLAIYLALEDEESGVVAKLAGKVEADPTTGRLTARFAENPELPIEDIDVSFFKGAGAALKSPFSCGTHTTTAELVPWSTPEGATANPSDSFATTNAAAGGSCPSSEAAAPHAPTFSAGTVAPSAALFSPFVLKVSRPDGSQHITGINVTLPGGLVAKLAGVPYCSEVAIAAAKSREAPNQGAAEQQSPSCPSASEVGSVTVGAGAGPTPFYATGHVYMAGPYKGAPLSMVVIAPAVAGPFDLGTVVSRVALNVGQYTAQVEAVSDPLPTIVQGVPLDIRSIALKLDRPNFTLNPTSCEQMQITGKATSPTGAVASMSNRFQVGGCSELAFKPKLAISLKGGTKRGAHPALKATVTFPGKAASANIASAQVGLPHSAFLDQGNIKTVCKQADLAAATCPSGSIYGHVKVWTPLLDQPLEGPVYLGVGFGHKLPDLVADLNGQLRILAHGRVDTNKQDGIRNTFEAVPDAPVSKIVIEMQGGAKKGLIVNSTNICQGKQLAEARFTGQNGKVASFKPVIGNSCKGKHKGKQSNKKKGGEHGR